MYIHTYIIMSTRSFVYNTSIYNV